MDKRNFWVKLGSNRNIWLLLSLTAGLIFPAGAIKLRVSLPAFLGLLMTLSFAGFSLRALLPLHTLPRRLAGPFLVNYLLFGMLLMGIAALLIPADRELLTGFLFIALAPPGIVIVPFAIMLRGDTNLASTGVIGGYLAFLLFFPLAVILFWGGKLQLLSQVVQLVVFAILIPLFVSRILRRGAMGRWIQPRRGTLIDAGFAIIVYIIVGLNQHSFTNSLTTLIKPMLVLAIVLFGGGFLYEKVQIRFKRPPAYRISNALLFNVKNTGFAAVTSVAIAGERAAIPSAALSVVLLLYLLMLSIRENRG